MRAIEFLTEAAGTVGRKYQHIEDLVITNGSNGGNITLTHCKLYGNISSSGLFTFDTDAQSSNTFPAMSGGLNGNVTLEGSTNIPDTMIGNLITSTDLNRGRGVNGSNILGVV